MTFPLNQTLVCTIHHLFCTSSILFWAPRIPHRQAECVLTNNFVLSVAGSQEKLCQKASIQTAVSTSTLPWEVLPSCSFTLPYTKVSYMNDNSGCGTTYREWWQTIHYAWQGVWWEVTVYSIKLCSFLTSEQNDHIRKRERWYISLHHSVGCCYIHWTLCQWQSENKEIQKTRGKDGLFCCPVLQSMDDDHNYFFSQFLFCPASQTVHYY